MNLFFSEKSDPSKALVQSIALPFSIPMRELVYEDEFAVNVYITDGISGYSAVSGEDGYVLKIGVGKPGAVPTGGTFTLTFSSQTTEAIAFDATAAEVQAALEALSNIGSGNVIVTGESPAWGIEFVESLGLSNQPQITADARLLTPASNAVASTTQSGDDDQNENQFIRLTRNPAWLTNNFSQITNGWSGVLALNTKEVYELFEGGDAPVNVTLEVEITSPQGRSLVYASVPFRMLHRITSANSGITNPLNHSGDGEVAIAEGAEVVTVTGLNLHLTPRRVLVSVRKPAGGDNLFASLVDGSVSANGFQVNLSGQTTSDAFLLDYILLF